jgi:hypothetical protein
VSAQVCDLNCTSPSEGSHKDGSKNPPMAPISETLGSYIFVHFKPRFSTWEGYGRVGEDSRSLFKFIKNKD